MLHSCDISCKENFLKNRRESRIKKRNYCIFVANYLPNLGGVERYTYNLAKTLVKQGNNVTVVTSNVFLFPDQEVIDGINILRMPCWNILNGRFPLLKFGRKFLALNKLLNTSQFDFVIVQIVIWCVFCEEAPYTMHNN